MLPQWRRFINDDDCAFVCIDEDVDDDDISGRNEKKQITERERAQKPHKIGLQPHHWLKISHGKMARILSVLHVCSRTNTVPKITRQWRTDTHAYTHSRVQVLVQCLRLYVSNKSAGVFAWIAEPEACRQKCIHKCASIFPLSLLLFFGKFICFRLQFTYGREIEFTGAKKEMPSTPSPKSPPICLVCERLFLLFTFISLCHSALLSCDTSLFRLCMICLTQNNSLNYEHFQPELGPFYLKFLSTCTHEYTPKIRQFRKIQFVSRMYNVLVHGKKVMSLHSTRHDTTRHHSTCYIHFHAIFLFCLKRVPMVEC